MDEAEEVILDILEILRRTDNPNYPGTWPEDERNLYVEVTSNVSHTVANNEVLRLRAKKILDILSASEAKKDPSVVFTLTLKDGDVVETWLRETISLPEFVLKLAAIAVGFAAGEAERL